MLLINNNENKTLKMIDHENKIDILVALYWNLEKMNWIVIFYFYDYIRRTCTKKLDEV